MKWFAFPIFRLFRLALLVGVVVVLGVQVTSAHGYLIRAIPDDRAVLARPPARLQYWFSEPLEPKFSTLTVRDQAGNTLATGGIDADNSSLLTVRLPRLPDGAYIVDMRIAFASDGHVIAQSSVFFVGTATSDLSGQAASTQADPLEAVWRALSLSGTMLLFGVFAVYAYILVPAWGNSIYRAGLLPPRVMRRINTLIVVGLLLSLVGAIIAILQQSMTFFNADLNAVISGNLWSVVRVGTRFGEVWSARMLLLGIVAAAFGLSLFFREDQPESVRPFLTACVWAMLLVIGSYSIVSHAAGSQVLPWVGILVDWLHGVGVGVWVGSVAALTLILPAALQTLTGDARRLALLAALRRFSRWAVAALVIVIVSGIYSATNWIYAPSDLTQTSFGGALIAKLILVAALMAFGAAHHLALNPERYQSWQWVIKRVGHFLTTLRLETLFAAAVLASVGVLSATPVPIPEFAKTVIPPPSANQRIGDLDVMLTLTPGGAGVNTYDAFVSRDGQPLEGLKVQVQFASPERDWRGSWEAAEDVESGLYVASGAEIDRVGRWLSLVDITFPDGAKQRVVFDWYITDETAVQQSRPPSAANWLALGAVLIACGWVLYPSAYKGYKRLDINPATLTVVGGAVVALVVFSVVGIVLIQNIQTQYELTLNPPPTILNSVIPDAASLGRGADLFTANCTGWEGTALSSLITRMQRTRDDQLFATVRDGAEGLPACKADLDETQRWDLVNYIRTLAQ